MSNSKNGDRYLSNNNDLMHTMTKDEAYYNKKFMDPGKSGYHFKIGSKSKYQSPVPAEFMINEQKGKINYVNS